MDYRKLQQRDGIKSILRCRLCKAGRAGDTRMWPTVLHIINGDEMGRSSRCRAAPALRRGVVTGGAPLLSSMANYAAADASLRRAADAAAGSDGARRSGCMGHGASHVAAYACLDHGWQCKFPATQVGAVESYPEVDHVVTNSRRGVTGACI